MLTNHEPITFELKDDKWRARVGDLEVVIERLARSAPCITLIAYDQIHATPCDEEVAEGICPDGKEIGTYENMVACGKTCPHWRDVETESQCHVIFGGPSAPETMEAMAFAARKQLRDERLCDERDPMGHQSAWEQRFAGDFIGRDWLVDGALLPALTESHARHVKRLPKMK